MHFLRLCSLSAFTHAAVRASDRIFRRAGLLAEGRISLTLLSLSIHKRRCSRIRSRFPSFFTPAAFPHAVVLAYDRIFSLALHSHMPLFNHTNAFWLLLLSCAISHAAVLAYDPIFTASALSPHSHTPLLTRTNAFSLAQGMLIRCCSR